MRLALLILLAGLALAGCGNGSSATGHGGGSGDVAGSGVVLSVGLKGGGRVRSAPAGIDCGNQCSARYPAATIVTLTAVPDSGQSFAGWAGDCSGTASCTLTMDRAHAVTAVFQASGSASVPLLVTRSGAGSGSVISSPAGIDCGNTCAADFPDGSTVTLTATPAPGSAFTGFGGDCSRNPCTLSMTQVRRVTATFATLPPAAPTGLWLGGDMHVHTDHSSDGSLPRQAIDEGFVGNVSVADQIGEAERGGAQWLPITDHRTYDQHYDPLWESSTLILIPGEEANSGPHCTVHGAVDMIDQGNPPDGSPEFRSVQQSIWSAHAQDATYVIAHPDDGMVNDDGTPNARASLVGMDSIEGWNRGSNIEAELAYAENRWNHGFRFGINGGSDDHFRELWGVSSPGTPRTLVFASEARERAILQAQRAGRFSIHLRPNSPMVTLEADFQNDGVYEAIAGDEVFVPAGTAGTLRIRVTNGLLDTVSLYQAPGASAPAIFTAQPTSLDETYTVAVTAPAEPTWYRVEVRGLGEPAFVDTNAIKSFDIALILQQAQQLLGNQLKAVAAPIFVSQAPVYPVPEIPIPADIGGDDGAQILLGEVGRWTGFAAIADSAFGTHVVAESHGPGSTQIVYTRRNGSTQTAPLILSGGSAFARFPKVAASGANVWVVWEDERAGQTPRRKAIYLRQSVDGGTTWLPEVLLRSVPGRAEHPVVAALPTGKAVVAWQEIQSGQPFDVWAQVIGADAAPVNVSGSGKTFGAATPLDTRSAVYPASVWPALAVADDGRIALAWQDNRGDIDPLFTGHLGTADGTVPDDWQILVATRTAAIWTAAVALGAADRADRHPALAFGADGRLVAAWDSKPLEAAGPNLSVLAATSRDGGATFGTPVLIGGSATAFAQRPALTRGRDGRPALAWFDNRSSDWRWRLMTARQADDASWSSGTLIPSRGISTWPALSGEQLAFSSTRNAQRLQRDLTQQIALMPLPR